MGFQWVVYCRHLQALKRILKAWGSSSGLIQMISDVNVHKVCAWSAAMGSTRVLHWEDDGSLPGGRT